MEQQEVAGRHGSPLPGNSPHDRPVSRVTFSSLKESLRRSLPRHFTPVRSRTITELSTRFQGMAESFWSDGVQNQKPNPGSGPYRLPLVGPEARQRTRREDHAPSHRPQMSSGRLFLDRVGRHQSPPPLRRHAQTTTHFPVATPKPELSTLLGSGTFYFALTIYSRHHWRVPLW